MVAISDLKKISDYEWEIPQGFREDMRVPVRVFVTRDLLEQATRDKSLEQAVNAATLPGLVGYVTVMPDMHQGYGFPIGGVAATRYPEGVISPGAIGYDINCGVRLLGSQIEAEAAQPHMELLATALNKYCPSGVGKGGSLRLSEKELDLSAAKVGVGPRNAATPARWIYAEPKKEALCRGQIPAPSVREPKSAAFRSWVHWGRATILLK